MSGRDGESLLVGLRGTRPGLRAASPTSGLGRGGGAGGAGPWTRMERVGGLHRLARQQSLPWSPAQVSPSEKASLPPPHPPLQRGPQPLHFPPLKPLLNQHQALSSWMCHSLGQALCLRWRV